MNFFQAQEKAKKRTFYLIFAFIIGVIAILLIVNGFILSLLALVSEFQYPKDDFISKINFHIQHGEFLAISIFILLIVLIGALYQSYKLRKGGKSVMEDLGARLLSKESANLQESVLLNVVDEMSIASGVPPPAVYLLDDESINAFASGFSIDDATICLTSGSVKSLNRQELQGVVAHEFSHIFSGDMNLYMKTSSIIYGILAIAITGKWLLQALFSSKENKRSSKNSGGAILFLFMLGLGLIILGYLGTLIGNIIKASISRQREFNADATAVKYTRDTIGISNALKKIHTFGSQLKAKNASTYSHFYFAKGVSRFFDKFFATHPPLEERILRIEPYWDGDYEIKTIKKKKSTQKKKKTKEEYFESIFKTKIILDGLDDSGVLKEENIQKVTKKIKQIPKILNTMANDAFTSRALILALLASDIVEVPQEKLNEFAINNPKLYRQIKLVLNNLADLDKSDYLTMLLLCLSSLKQMSKKQYLEFKEILLEWIWENQKIVFFEWIVKRIIISPLDIYFGITKPLKERYSRISSLKSEIEFFISFLCLQECENEKKAKELFEKTINYEKLQRYEYVSLDKLDYQKLGEVVDILILSNANIRRRIFQMAIFIYTDDKILSPQNKQMLHALSLGLKIPLPYM